LTSTFFLSFNTDAGKSRSLRVRNARTDLDPEDFMLHVNRIIGSGVLNTGSSNVTGIRKAELVTETRQRYI
jgi:hypothetical protein